MTPPGQSWSHRIRVVGYHDLDARPAFKLAMQEVGGRFYLYTGHLWHRGWSVLDVTDPGAPRLLRFVDGPANTWTIQIQVAAGRMITALERIAPGWGGDADAPSAEGVLVWDVSDPEAPKRLGQFTTDGGGTHRNYYDGGRYLHLAAGVAGYVGNIYLVVDLAEPSAPKEVARWWVPGQWREGGETGAAAATSLHGGPYIEGDRAYLPYGGAGLVILDVADVTRPRLVSRLSFSPPFQSFIAVHTAVPLPARKLVSVNSEAIKEDCDTTAVALPAARAAARRAVPQLLSARGTLRPPQPAPGSAPGGTAGSRRPRFSHVLQRRAARRGHRRRALAPRGRLVRPARSRRPSWGPADPARRPVRRRPRRPPRLHLPHRQESRPLRPELRRPVAGRSG
jgi:hypothetical protein